MSKVCAGVYDVGGNVLATTDEVVAFLDEIKSKEDRHDRRHVPGPR